MLRDKNSKYQLLLEFGILFEKYYTWDFKANNSLIDCSFFD